MPKENAITFMTGKRRTVLDADTILYVLMSGNYADIHTSDGKIHRARMTFGEIEKMLGEGFIKIHRGGIVSARAIYDITDRVNLINGESLIYTQRKKRQITERLKVLQKHIVESFGVSCVPMAEEEYRAHFAGFEDMPFAFADIEMVFDDESRAVDWIFRYGNDALARLENTPLERLIGSSFGSIFPNMDSKWLRCYERATLFGETLELIDYSPEIDTYLKVICFPTFKGHCGCILFDISDIKFTENSPDAGKALAIYLGDALNSLPH